MAKDNSTILKKLKELDSIINDLSDKDPKKEEATYYEKYNYTLEKDKLLAELQLINHKINGMTQEEETENDASLVNALSSALENIDKPSSQEIKSIKKMIILLELQYGIPIRLYSEVESLYQDLFENAKKEKKNKRGMR